MGTLYLNQMKITYKLLAVQLDPSRRNGGEMEEEQGGGREGRRTQGREGGSEADRTKEKGKEGGIEAGRRKKETVGPLML